MHGHDRDAHRGRPQAKINACRVCPRNTGSWSFKCSVVEFLSMDTTSTVGKKSETAVSHIVIFHFSRNQIQHLGSKSQNHRLFWFLCPVTIKLKVFGFYVVKVTKMITAWQIGRPQVRTTRKNDSWMQHRSHYVEVFNAISVQEFFFIDDIIHLSP